MTSDHKECIRCHASSPLSNFYAHKGMADGLLNACKPCVKLSSLAWGRVNKTSRKRCVARHQANLPASYLIKRGWNPRQVPVWYSELDAFVWEEAQMLARLREEITGVPHHVDHMFPGKSPLVSGFHCAANWQVISAVANQKKWRHLDYTS